MKMVNNNIIAIDGQSYVGKSTISNELAKLMSCIYINTGHLYRAVAYEAIKSGIDSSDHKSIISVVNRMKIQFKFYENKTRTIINDKDLTYSLDNPKIVSYSSKIALIPDLREQLNEIQRSYTNQGMVIIEGRDIGKVVFPNAAWKIFLTASTEVRAKRMKKVLIEKDPSKKLDISDLIKEVIALDQRDTNREIAHLKILLWILFGRT